MASIRKLSQEIIGQIAAGEVVERPAAAVKELVENSIDAGAKNVTVELREGGIKYLRVTDNGKGIPADQIRMAFERNATSKISEPKDLFDIQTLGFRGEALASIAAVSKVTCTTRTQEAAFGTRAVVEAGEFCDIRQAASPVGTTIVAEELFYNTPVRLRFLKKPAAEAALVSDYMLRLILSHPEISFRYMSQGKTVYRSSGDGSVESALYALYGREAFQQMRKVSGHMNGVLVSGFVGVGELCRGNRQQQSFFVNGRYFRSGALSAALEKGCEGRVMVGRFPLCALYLEIPRAQVDVNVHPNKLEVRFQNEAAVAAAVEQLVREAMQAESLSERLTAAASLEQTQKAKPAFAVVDLPGEPKAPEPKAEVPAPEPQKVDAPVPKPEPVPVKDADIAAAISHLTPIVVKSAPARPQTVHESDAPAPVSYNVQAPPMSYLPPKPAAKPKPRPEPVPVPAAKPEPVPAPKPAPVPVAPPEQMTMPEAADRPKPPRLVGIVFDTYWVFEAGDRLLLVDQHAAHERMLYDQMLRRFENERISQSLLTPQLVKLTPVDMLRVEEFAPLLSEAGFEVEAFDETSVALRAVPTLFGENDDPKELLLEALAEWQSGHDRVTRERLRRRVAQMACKRAIKGGDKLTDTEITGFLADMLKSESMPTCPHGRPIVTEVTRTALEKRFKRIQ